VAANVGEARGLHKLTREQDRQGFLGHVQGEHALAKLAHGVQPGRDPYGPGSFPRPYLPGEEEPPAPVGGTTKPEGGA